MSQAESVTTVAGGCWSVMIACDRRRSSGERSYRVAEGLGGMALVEVSEGR